MIKSSWLKRVMVLAFVLSPAVLLAGEPGKAAARGKKDFYCRMVPSGRLLIFHSTGPVGDVVPEIFTEGWKYNKPESRGTAEKRKGTTWQIVLGNGTVVDLKTEVKPLPAGLHIRYTMVPRENVKVNQVRAAVLLFYSDWQGASYQLGSSKGSVPLDRAPGAGTICESDSAPLSLGPAPAQDGLRLQMNQTTGLHLSLQDDRQRGNALVAYLTHHESAAPAWDWKAGEEKTFDFSLTFEPPAALVEPVREPQRPFPYREEEVEFFNAKDGVKLAGTLTLPKGKGPFPAVVLIHPAGSGDRDGSWLGDHHSFLVLSDYLTRHGFSVLRYDKRGGGLSGGNFQTATMADFAEDARAGFEYLRGRKEVNPRKVGLIGHSEGGRVAPMVAAKSKDVAFLVSMEGAGMDEKSLSEITLIRNWKAEGYSDAFVSLVGRVQDQIVREVVKPGDQVQAVSRVSRIIHDGTDQAKRDFPKEFDPAFWSSWFNADNYSSPHSWFLWNYNPEKDLRSVSCPFLEVNGDKSLGEPTDVIWPYLEKNFKEGNNPEFTTKLLPGVNHMFQNCKTGSAMEWAANPETLAPQALEFITEWMTKQKPLDKVSPIAAPSAAQKAWGEIPPP